MLGFLFETRWLIHEQMRAANVRPAWTPHHAPQIQWIPRPQILSLDKGLTVPRCAPLHPEFHPHGLSFRQLLSTAGTR